MLRRLSFVKTDCGIVRVESAMFKHVQYKNNFFK